VGEGKTMAYEIDRFAIRRLRSMRDEEGLPDDEFMQLTRHLCERETLGNLDAWELLRSATNKRSEPLPDEAQVLLALKLKDERMKNDPSMLLVVDIIGNLLTRDINEKRLPQEALTHLRDIKKSEEDYKAGREPPVVYHRWIAPKAISVLVKHDSRWPEILTPTTIEQTHRTKVKN